MDFTGPAWIHGWALRGGRFSSPAPRPSILGNISEISQKYFLDILPIFPQRGRATEARPLGAKTGPFQLEKYLLDICSTFVKYSFPISCLLIYFFNSIHGFLKHLVFLTNHLPFPNKSSSSLTPFPKSQCIL